MSNFLNERYHTLARSQLGIPEDYVVFGTASSIEVEWGTPGDPEDSETFAVDLPAEYSLVRIEAPVRDYHNQEDTGYSFSWGHYRITWLLCDRIEDAVQAGLRWAEEMGQKDKAKAAKKGGSR